MHRNNKSYASVTDLITNFDNYVPLNVISASTGNNRENIEDNSFHVHVYKKQTVFVELEANDILRYIL